MAENDKKNVTAKDLLKRLNKDKDGEDVFDYSGASEDAASGVSADNTEASDNPDFQFVTEDETAVSEQTSKEPEFVVDESFSGDSAGETEFSIDETNEDAEDDFVYQEDDEDVSATDDSQEITPEEMLEDVFSEQPAEETVTEPENEGEVPLFDEGDNFGIPAEPQVYEDDTVSEDETAETDYAEYGEQNYSEFLETTPEAVTDSLFDDNIIPEDDFFDNDPIVEEEPEEETVEEPVAEEQPAEEVDPETDFENLVAEVTGDSQGEDFDETDISLAVALGMEDELYKVMDSEKAEQLTEDFVADQEEWIEKNDRYSADEYTDPSQNREIAETYKKRNTFSLIKMLGSLALLILIIFYENLPVIGLQFSGMLDPAVYPVVYIMFDLQIVFVAAALVISEIWDGFKALIKFKPNINSISTVLLILATLTAVISSFRTYGGIEPIVFNVPTVLSLFLIALNNYLTVRREIFSFNVVSSRKPKFVMRHLSTRDSMMESEAVAGMQLDTSLADEGDIIKIQKTDFAEGYFYHTNNKGTTGNSYCGLAIGASIALGLIVAIYAAVTKSASMLQTGYATVSASLPASMILISCFPFYSANKLAYDNDSTIIGEGSVEEYSGVGVISFDDVNVFSSNDVKVKNVRLYNNSRIDKVLYYASSVFSATGGPLADVFEVATFETGRSSNVEIIETGNGYIEAKVSDKSVIFGRADALSNIGIILPSDVTSEEGELPPGYSVMYMIYQHKLVSKMIVSYTLDPDFEYILKQLTESGMCVCVKTFDPNIDEEMIYRQVSSDKYSLRVIKYKNTEEITKYAKRADGGIVSRDSTKSLLKTVSLCDKILSAKKTGFVIGVISAIVSAVVIGAFVVAGRFETLHSIIPAGLQLFWLIPTLIASKTTVR